MDAAIPQIACHYCKQPMGLWQATKGGPNLEWAHQECAEDYGGRKFHRPSLQDPTPTDLQQALEALKERKRLLEVAIQAVEAQIRR